MPFRIISSTPRVRALPALARKRVFAVLSTRAPPPATASHPRAFRHPSPVVSDIFSLPRRRRRRVHLARVHLPRRPPPRRPRRARRRHQPDARRSHRRVRPRHPAFRLPETTQRRRRAILRASGGTMKEGQIARRVRVLGVSGVSGVSARRGARGKPPRDEPNGERRSRRSDVRAVGSARSSREHAPLVSPPLARR